MVQNLTGGEMRKIALISTGGTIASKVDTKTGKMMAGLQTGEELLAQCNLADMDKDVGITINSLFQIPSNQMTFEKNLIIYQTMKQMEKDGYSGFVVTHGTDTLEESAYFINLLWDSELPVVFTGSQFSPTVNNTDAFHNISNALLVASSPTSKGMGVLVAFNDRIFSSQYVTKLHASNIDGFGAPRSGPLGIVDYGRVHYFQKPIQREVFKIENSLPKVEIISQYIGMDASIFDYYILNGTRGLIIEGYGRGHSSLETAEKVKKATGQGIIVVVTSTCIDGEVAPVYAFRGGLNDLLLQGAISGYDYMPKKARIKLMVLMASGLKEEEIKKKFEIY